MYRVLHIMAGADAGGISTVVLNYYKYIDRKKIHFDIAITTDMVGQNGKRLKELGCNIYFLPLKSKGINKFKKSLRELLNDEHFDAIHVHENETSYIALSVAKKIGIKKRIAHAHTTSPTDSLLGEIRRLSGCVLNDYYATNLIGCGKLAGERVFGKKNMKKRQNFILPNAIETEKFHFNSKVRENIRKELDVENKYVIGMVGRLDYQKNQDFILKIMDIIHNKNNNVVLLLVGNGPDEDKLKKVIEEKNMNNYVKLLGRRSDVEELYMGFDLFVMPSLSEGFPVAAVEAITSGLPTLLSNNITNELSFSKLIKYLPLDSNEWINAILRCEINNCREESKKNIKEHHLDILDTSKILENIYLQ